MSDAVTITAMICLTLIIISIISKIYGGKKDE